MKRTALCIAAAVALMLPAAISATPILLSGDGAAANRINLVFTGDGYTADQVTYFVADCNRILTTLKQEPFFSRFEPVINVYAAFKASAASGARNGNTPPTATTAFDSYFNCAGIDRLLCVGNYSALLSFFTAEVPFFDASVDIGVVIVNDTKYGGSGGQFAVTSVNSSAAEICIHEIGHSFARLGDEYEYAGGSSSENPNTTAQSTRAGVKWNAWINDTTPVPTPEIPAYNSAVGVFEGACYAVTGWYRPMLNCKMQSLGVPMCPVCSEAFVTAAYSSISPIDGCAPAVGSTVERAFRSGLRVAPIPLAAGMRVDWEINGVRCATHGDSLTLDDSLLESGANTVRAIVTDTTDLVRNPDTRTLASDNVAWTVVAHPYAMDDTLLRPMTFTLSALLENDWIFSSRRDSLAVKIVSATGCAATDSATVFTMDTSAIHLGDTVRITYTAIEKNGGAPITGPEATALIIRDRQPQVVTMRDTTVIFGSRPLPLVATASSGLPVTFSVHSSDLDTALLCATSDSLVVKHIGHVRVIAYGDSIAAYPAYDTARVTILPETLVVTAFDTVMDLGDDEPGFTAEITGFVYGDDASVLTSPVQFTRDTGSGEGVYAIHPSGAVAENYLFSYVDGALTIRAKTGIVDKGEDAGIIAVFRGIAASSNPVALSAGSVDLIVLPEGPSVIHLVICDAVGNVIDEQNGETKSGGSAHRFSWDLKNLDGVTVSAGGYLAVAKVKSADGLTKVYKTMIGVIR